MPKIQFKGLVRFSYLSKDGFKVSKNGLGAVEAMLYDPARLARRFDLFERFALQSLAHQTDKEFQCGILIGDSFPTDARNRLEDLLVGHNWAKIITLPPLMHYQSTLKAFDQLDTDQDATHCATFRLDDDDAMHIETIAKTRALAEGLLNLRSSKKPFVVGFNRGYFLNLEDPFTLEEVTEKTPLGIGLSVIAPAHQRINVFRRNHRLVAQFFDCYTDVNTPMFVRTIHGENDSDTYQSGSAKAVDRKIAALQLRDGFGLTL